MYTNNYPALGLTTNSAFSKILSYEPVRDVYNWGREIFRQYAGEQGVQDYDSKNGRARPIGMQTAHQVGETLEQRIAYEEQNTPWKTLFVRGHEEGHALHAEGREDKLLHELHKSNVATNYAPSNYWKTSTADKEYFAHLAGLYALQREGYDVRHYGPALVDAYGASQLAEAVGDYLKAMNSEATPIEHRASKPTHDFSIPTLKPSDLLEIYHFFTSSMRTYVPQYAR